MSFFHPSISAIKASSTSVRYVAGRHGSPKRSAIQSLILTETHPGDPLQAPALALPTSMNLTQLSSSQPILRWRTVRSAMSLLEDKHGIPWTAHVGPVLMTLFVLVTLGLGPILLAIYLGVWIGLRRRAWLPLVCFLTFSLIALLSYSAIEHAILSGIMDALILMSPFIWIGGNFLLREEILKDAHAQGFQRDISRLLTFFLSSLYLNFCLNPSTFNAERRHLPPLKLTDVS